VNHKPVHSILPNRNYFSIKFVPFCGDLRVFPLVLKVQEGGEKRESKMLSRQDYGVVGFIIGAIATYFVTSNWTATILGAAAGSVLLYYFSPKDFDFSNLLRKVLGSFLVIYGVFAELSPSRYPIGTVPESQIPVVALGMILFGLYLLRHELGFV
jgi:uncharacterized membrane protein YeaQ/YmgE (transglycosylase-associated protein family)